jgi:putative membrane protein
MIQAVIAKVGIGLSAAVVAACVGVMAEGSAWEGPKHAGMAGQRTMAAEVKEGDVNNDKLTSDQKFLVESARGSLMEVELGRVAKNKSRETEVRDFGNRMVEDHSKALRQIEELASKKGVTVSTALDEKHQKIIERYEKFGADEFDTKYINHMVRDHEKDLSEAESQAKNAKDSDIAEFAARLVPIYRSHLDQARKVQRDLKLEDKNDEHDHNHGK